MQEKIEIIKRDFLGSLESVTSLNGLNDLRVNYLGKKGLLAELGAMMRDLSNDERKELGFLLNSLKDLITDKLDAKKVILEESALNEKLSNEKIDITLPGTNLEIGTLHPLSKIVDEVKDLFISMGYDVVEGPEIEFDLYNFEKLNLPKGHPARDSQDSFYITDEVLLRTQTSPVQAREMEKNTQKGPIRIIAPGKTYRRDSDDATHSHQFMQIEGLVIDENISVADLKGTLTVFAKKMFGDDREIRFRPSFFPFTEPSMEVDVSCFKCGGAGCSLCKGSGWIEVLGSGMVHPHVLKAGGYDPEKYTGFAFGMGPERIAMLKYGITDIRNFYTNDLRFIDQFNRIEGSEK